jgi:hypothetical protein
MPYIDPTNRSALDPAIERLAEDIKELTEAQGDPGAYAGLLNYACTRLALEVIPGRRYVSIATVTGVFQNIISEFYRRFAAPYEDEKIQANGDVYLTSDDTKHC